MDGQGAGLSHPPPLHSGLPDARRRSLETRGGPPPGEAERGHQQGVVGTGAALSRMQACLLRPGRALRRDAPASAPLEAPKAAGRADPALLKRPQGGRPPLLGHRKGGGVKRELVPPEAAGAGGALAAAAAACEEGTFFEDELEPEPGARGGGLLLGASAFSSSDTSSMSASDAETDG